MVYFPFFADTVTTLDEAAVAWLLALQEVGIALGFEFVCVLEVVFDRRHGGVLADVEVEVEVCSVGTDLVFFSAVSFIGGVVTGVQGGLFFPPNFDKENKIKIKSSQKENSIRRSKKIYAVSPREGARCPILIQSETTSRQTRKERVEASQRNSPMETSSPCVSCTRRSWRRGRERRRRRRWSEN